MINKPLHFFFLMRPVLFFPAWSTLLLAYLYEHKIEQVQFLLNSNDLILRFISFAVIMGASFIVNQITDIDTDKENNKLPILSSGLLTIREAWFFSTILIIVVLVLSYYYNFYIFLLNILFFLITGVLYNLKPFVLKNRMISGALANYFMGILAYLFACSEFQIVNTESFVLLSVINFSLFVLTTLPDIKGDRKTEKRTIGSVLGLEKSLRINFLILAAMLIISIILSYKVTLVYYLLALQLIFAIYLLIKKSIESVIFVIKLFLLIQALAVCLFFPDYFFLILLMYLGGRAYYRRYFNINYPHIKDE